MLGVVAAGLVAIALAGCSSEVEPVGELVGRWSQGSDPGWVDDAMPIATTVIATDDERQDWLDDVAGDAVDAELDELRQVDLDHFFLVIGGYPRCTEYSAVLVENDGSVTFDVRTDDENVACVWAPYTIDAWAVPLSETGGEPPSEVS